MRIERYPFCARRCLSKKEKETGRELNGSLDRSLLFWFATNRNGFIRFQFNGSSLVDIEFRVRSVVFFDLHDRSETRSSSSRKQAHEILMTVTTFFTTLTPNGLTRRIRQLFP